MLSTLPLLIDVNLNHRILRGLLLRVPALNFKLAANLGLREAPDDVVLAWAAEHSSIVVTHDVSTMPGFAYDRLTKGEHMPGVIVIPERLPIRKAIEELEIIVQCLRRGEIENQVILLPFL